MKKIFLLFLSSFLILFTFYSCKKSSSAPSIVGTWTFTNISGVDSLNNAPQTQGQVTTYSYNSAANTITASTTDSGYTTQRTMSIIVTSETWTFNADGKYITNETFASPLPIAIGTSQASVDTGTWVYAGNAQSDSVFILTGAVSNVFQFINPTITNSGIYTYHIAGSTMTLSDFQVMEYSAEYLDSVNIAITFTKQ
jgi:hypothetical protein